MEKVKSLFCSVKLNVNNPHFLIMQGRITKITNMKPIEIVSLIEEAAGTSVYQQKREQALSHVQKKDLKLQEIDNILKSELTPKLEQLQKDKHALDEHKAQTSNLEKSEKILIAFKYHDFDTILRDPKGRSQELTNSAKCIEARLANQ